MDVSVQQDRVAPPDGEWTQCTSPDGYAVCGGPAQCPASSAACQSCGVGSIGGGDAGGAQGSLYACVNDALVAFGAPSDKVCLDGAIYVAEYAPDAFVCAPYDLGVLFAKNGATDRVRYVDMGVWTGDPLPLPTSCPNIPGLQLCGGNCGPCPNQEMCTGRSPLHPYSFCVPQDTGASPGLGCNAGSGCPGPGNVPDAGIGCLTYKVEPSAQAFADKSGICLPDDLCKAAAAGLPGGGTCSM